MSDEPLKESHTSCSGDSRLGGVLAISIWDELAASPSDYTLKAVQRREQREERGRRWTTNRHEESRKIQMQVKSLIDGRT